MPFLEIYFPRYLSDLDFDLRKLTKKLKTKIKNAHARGSLQKKTFDEQCTSKQKHKTEKNKHGR